MTKTAQQSFFASAELGISPGILKVLESLGLEQPTPIQQQSIPVGISGKDLVGIAQTGTGKTLAYSIPLIQRLASAQHEHALVVLPTRELAAQVEANMRALTRQSGIRTAVLIGGQSKHVQLKQLRARPRIIIATPGRLIDMLQTREISLDKVSVVVLDEADMMFDIGFAPQVKEILKATPPQRQTLLFSATMPPAIMSLVNQHMKLPVTIEVAPAGTPAEKVSQEMVVIKREDRTKYLHKILTTTKGSVLVFCRTKHGVKKLAQTIYKLGFSSGEIHSNRSLAQRTSVLKGFKSGAVRVLVATDIAARGIDVKGIELVVNYDLPEKTEDYVHRIGRTGRAGNVGKAISFVSPTEMREVTKIERIIKSTIPLTKVDEPQYDARGNQREFSGRRPQRQRPRLQRSTAPRRSGGGKKRSATDGQRSDDHRRSQGSRSRRSSDSTQSTHSSSRRNNRRGHGGTGFSSPGRKRTSRSRSRNRY